MKPLTLENLADLAEEMQDYTPDPEQLRLVEKAARLLRVATWRGHCGCELNGVRQTRANCPLHRPVGKGADTDAALSALEEKQTTTIEVDTQAFIIIIVVIAAFAIGFWFRWVLSP